MTPWHRAFGFALTDFFWETNYKVELEKDLSLKQQFLDVIIVEQISTNPTPQSLPDGLDNLSQHNLLSYKSLAEPLDPWALDELIGHFVNYRKQISPSMQTLLPEGQFQLFAVATRMPQKLARESHLHRVQAGVFDIQWGIRRIRVLVLSQMPLAERNAIWQLFSNTTQGLHFGQQRYRWKIPNISSIIRTLYQGIKMTYTVEDFRRDLPKELLAMMSPEYRSILVENISTDEMIQHLSADEMIQHLSSDEMLQHLSSDEMIQHLSADEMIKHLSADELANGLDAEGIKSLSPEQRQKMLDLLSATSK